MNDENRKLWKLLWQDSVQLHSELTEFCYLFSENEDRVKLMNDVASIFFFRLQQTLWNSMLLQICKLTDPEKSSGKPNLSLPFFLKSSAADRSINDQNRAETFVVEAVRLSGFARDWRNRRIAHRDLSNATGAKLCEDATLAKVRQAATMIGNAMDAMDPDKGSTYWDPDVSVKGCSSLLNYLQEGLLSHDKRWASFERGELRLRDVWLRPD